MIGSNLDEIRYFVPTEGGEKGFLDTIKWIAKRDRALLNDQEKTMYDEFMGTMSNESEGSRLEQYCNDLNFRAGNTDMAIRHSAAGGNTYMYFVRKPVTTPQLGAIHACEIPYLFDTAIPDPMGSGEIVGTDECEFRHVAKEMWTNFARTGNPSTDKYEWKKFWERILQEGLLIRVYRAIPSTAQSSLASKSTPITSPWSLPIRS